MMQNSAAPKMLIICEALIFILFIRRSFVTSDISEVNESDINYTMYSTFYYDSYQNVSFADDFDLNKSSLSNSSSPDASTELESTLSVTEDSDTPLQSDVSRESSLFLTPDEDICNCDLTVSVCDINCCCDPDCREEDIQIFSECSHQVLTPDTNYCYQKDIILRNNTVYKMIKTANNPMFCIVHDNFKHHLHFKDMPVLKSHRDVITVLKYKYKNTYSWDTETKSTYDSRELKAGNPIYITSKKNNINSPWSLPSSCLSSACSCHEEVHYLVDFRSSCTHVIKDVLSECERSAILSGDHFVDFCLAQFKAVLPTNVSEGPSPCVVVGEGRRRPRRGSNHCEGVVRHIHFKVEHEGGGGAGPEISAEFEYEAVPFSARAVTQSYSVEFVWGAGGNATEGRKSGNPGYQAGLPVLAATNGTEGAAKVPLGEGLTVLATDEDGICANRRQNVLFGTNLRVGCMLKAGGATSCSRLRNSIAGTLLGPNGRHLFVGVFGDANASRPGDWIEAFQEGEEQEEEDTCLVSTGLRIHVLFAAVGTFSNPQHKIVGVRYLYSDRRLVHPGSGTISLSTSVSFFDVTLPAVERYAKVPAVRANLPADFFYPFLQGRAWSSEATPLVFATALLLLLCL